MTTEKYNIHTYDQLSNGLRTVHCHTDSPVEYCGIAVKVGSRNETPDIYGLAHFVEHTIFKGTARRKSWHIINRMESVGGELNAYTSEETTVVYSCFPAGHLARAVELIADLITSSTFPAAEIDREREVVLDEIDSYLDSPAEAIFDDFNDLMFAGSSLGHNILGTEAAINSFTSSTCREFLEHNYTPDNMVLFYSGPATDRKFLVLAERHFGHLNRHGIPAIEPVPVENAPFDIRRKMSTHQCHTVTGARIPGLKSDMRHAYALLCNIIGGPCMNSLLNIALRERRGYVYSVDAYTSLFTDCGTMTIYYGCDPEHVRPCRRLVANTIDSLCQSPMTATSVEKAKKQYLGQTIVASANHEQMAIGAGRAVLLTGSCATPEERIANIMNITPEQLRMAAEQIAPSRCSTLTFGE